MGPKAFITCYVCCREFGSRSIPFHEPKCLERWRSFNRNLPPEKRSHTPVKPVGWKYSTETTWVCTNCHVTVPATKRGEHAAVCFTNTKQKQASSDRSSDKSIMMVDKGSPRKGKENKNNNNNSNQVHSKHINNSNTISKENNSTEKSRNVSDTNNSKLKVFKEVGDKKTDNTPESKTNGNGNTESPTKVVSTSNRSVRPQTKILRRPTPNLKHPVIQVDSDETSDSQEKSKDDNPKRMKTNDEVKPKNFIMYNKYNVEKNIKHSPKERSSSSKESTSVPAVTGIPHPCHSCSRSVAPERLHSHARRDSRGLMLKKIASVDSKHSPQKKIPENDEKKSRDSKSDDDRGHKSHDRHDKGRSLSVNGHSPSKKVESQRASQACRICRREFDASSLLLHENNCLERWKKENEPNRQKSSPRKLEPDGKGENNDPSWQVVQAQLVPCPSCSRTFFPERLPVHQRVCKGKPNPNSLSRNSSFREQSSQQCDEEGDKPNIYVPCYICSRSFGSWVIQMHESQCLRKWRRENEKLPEELQQPEPHKQQLVLSDEGQIDWDSTEDDVAWESHLQQLVPCPRCGRTFFPDRLRVHGRSCKGPSNSRHPQNNKGT